MGLTNFPNGISSYGMPVIGSGGHMTTGDVYFVSSSTALSSNEHAGTDPNKPLATLNGAVSRVTANQGDIVFVLPNHAENVTSSTTQLLSVAGVKWIGLGSGTDRPTFTYTNTAGIFRLTGANTYVENFVFTVSVVSCVLGMSIAADHCTLMNCMWDWDAVHDEFLRLVECVDVDHTRIESCEFIGLHTASTSDDLLADQGITLSETNYTKIIGNVIFGHWGISAIVGSSSSDTDDFRGAVAPPDTTNENHGLMILRNDIFNNVSFTTLADTNGWCIDLNLPDSGLLADNRLGGNNLTASVSPLLDPGSCRSLENYATGADDTFGVRPLATGNSNTDE